MLYYDNINLSEGIEVAKSNDSKECFICHYWFFSDGFKFQDFVCSGCHDLMIMYLNISDTAIIIVKDVDYLCNILDI